VSATTRASFAVHNSLSDVERLLEGLDEVRRVMRLD
jgi:selenocysteine lyase/cysteine desulfurase